MRALACLLVLICMGLLTPSFAKERPIPIVLSTDIGNEIDDQWLLAHLLASPHFEVLGVASAHAPAWAISETPAKDSLTAIRQIVEERLALSPHPPLVQGSDRPLENAQTPRQSEAAAFIIEASRAFSSRKRLDVLVVGAATDAASALLIDPTLASRIRIVAMGFRNRENADEFNINNDPLAWQVILASATPLVIGDGDVTARDIALTQADAAEVLKPGGPIERWLKRDYDVWYEQATRRYMVAKGADGSPAWPLWDSVTLAFLRGWTTHEELPRPRMTEDKKLAPASGGGRVTWVTSIDRARLLEDFQAVIRAHSRTHAVRDFPCNTIGRDPLACWRRAPN